MSRLSSTHGADKERAQYFSQKTRIEECTWKNLHKMLWRTAVTWETSQYGTVLASCEHGNEHSGFVKGGESPEMRLW
jgi:hypothetical protein